MKQTILMEIRNPFKSGSRSNAGNGRGTTGRQQRPRLATATASIYDVNGLDLRRQRPRFATSTASTCDSNGIDLRRQRPRLATATASIYDVNGLDLRRQRPRRPRSDGCGATVGRLWLNVAGGRRQWQTAMLIKSKTSTVIAPKTAWLNGCGSTAWFNNVARNSKLDGARRSKLDGTRRSKLDGARRSKLYGARLSKLDGTRRSKLDGARWTKEIQLLIKIREGN